MKVTSPPGHGDINTATPLTIFSYCNTSYFQCCDVLYHLTMRHLSNWSKPLFIFMYVMYCVLYFWYKFLHLSTFLNIKYCNIYVLFQNTLFVQPFLVLHFLYLYIVHYPRIFLVLSPYFFNVISRILSTQVCCTLAQRYHIKGKFK